MLYVELFLIAISLSIDSFSLALSVGLNSSINKQSLKYSVVVGMFHFIMPLLGFVLRIFINKIAFIPNKEIFIIVIVFIIIGILLDKGDNKQVISPFVFAFSVSIDSFSIGVTLSKSNILISILMFSIVSFIFTYIGFKIANKVKNRFNEKSKFISIAILIIILIYNILK